jgi:putative ABC transport system permease protein
LGEKGLVFILGKSGSGKSTLLNVIGGLDRLDAGDIVIKGKSTKDFTQAEFDSYRNTYVGFIFQEYNLLPDLTVGDNIALAMRLQGLPENETKLRRFSKNWICMAL